jgi:hypothetical protein
MRIFYMKNKRSHIKEVLIIIAFVLGLVSIFALENHQSNQANTDNSVSEYVPDNPPEEPFTVDDEKIVVVQDYAIDQTPHPVNTPVNDNNREKPKEPDIQPAVNTVTETEIPLSYEDSKKIMTCSISIKCDNVLNHMDLLKENKSRIIPFDGIIMAARTVEFHEGETVFNILQRETKKDRIHLEFTKAPIYNSAYIEGIANLYEFDCGNLSGWMYKVNGNAPKYGSGLYTLKDGDIIEWEYTCDLGRDANGYTGE